MQDQNYEFFFPTENSSSLSPLGERGNRKTEGAPRFAGRGGEGVSPEQIDE